MTTRILIVHSDLRAYRTQSDELFELMVYKFSRNTGYLV